jgi:adenine-specific DNA-methyltransferase
MTDMQDDNQDIQNVPSSSPNFKTELAKKLQELIPEAIADGKVDTQKLKELLADDSGDDTERFGLFWPGKKRAMRAAQEPTSATLKPAPDESKDWDTTKNLFIEGDNLEVLKVLQRQYHNKIKMIYIDPPYNTGKDFVYPDNFKEGLANYLEFTKQVDGGGRKISTNSDTEGRYHSNWLNMMYPRLKLARNLMTDDGVIFMSIDNHEEENLKKLCNEIFGEDNFVNKYTWLSNLKGRQISGRGAAGTSETIFCYARNANAITEFRASASSLKEMMPNTYKGFNYDVKQDKYGSYVIKNELFNTNSIFNEQTRPNLVYDIYYNPNNGDVKTADLSDVHIYDGYYKISPKLNNNGTHKYHAYRWGRKKVEAETRDLEFILNGDSYKIYTKIRDIDSTIVKDIITDINTTQGSQDINRVEFDSKYFDFPKPVNLIKFFITIATKRDSIVLDFFSGSGTTAHATMQLNAEDGGNRQHIQVQLPEPTDENSEAYKAGYKNIAQIARERINRAGAKIKLDYAAKITEREQLLDIGYRTYKLADTNFIKWQNAYTQDVTQLQARLDLMRESSNDNASQLDLLTEIILKLGLELTTDVHQMTLENLPIYNAAGGSLLLYLDEHFSPTLDQLRTILEGEHKPVKFVILEDSFKGDDQLKTNLTQICKSNSIELWTV